MIHLTGTLICAAQDDLKIIETYLPDHIRLSRAEPGCISFNVTQTPDPLVWLLDETYADHAAYNMHQARNRASVWWAKSQGLIRDFKLMDQD